MDRVRHHRLLLLESELAPVDLGEPRLGPLLLRLAQDRAVKSLGWRRPAGAGPVALRGHRFDHRLRRHRLARFGEDLDRCVELAYGGERLEPGSLHARYVFAERRR